MNNVTLLIQREQWLLCSSHARPLRDRRMYLTPVHMLADGEDTPMLSARTQYLQIKQVKMKSPKYFYREHYEEAHVLQSL